MMFRWLLLCLLSAAVVGSTSCRRGRARGIPQAVFIREDGALELRLLSFNVRYENSGDRDSRSWRQRVVGAVKMIRREQPDVFGVQEALHGQVADLWASLPEYEFSGVGRDDGRRAGEYSGIFYQRDRFQPDETDGGTFWLSDTPEQVGSKSWGNEIPRVAVWLRLVDRATGRGFYVFNTHWDHRNQSSRERAALLIARRIDGRKHADEPVALIGDFNAMESNPGLIYLTGRRVALAGSEQTWAGGLLDTYQMLHPTEKNRRTLHFWSVRRDGLKVDHILVSRGAEVEAAEIITQDQPEISDHFPVISRVLFPLAR
jgi:endonuclease/exonuclease/phosphatase family metal-dependent hydrolase